jgi:hypothetical protein
MLAEITILQVFVHFHKQVSKKIIKKIYCQGFYNRPALRVCKLEKVWVVSQRLSLGIKWDFRSSWWQSMKVTVFWGVALCSLIEIDQCFQRCLLPPSMFLSLPPPPTRLWSTTLPLAPLLCLSLPLSSLSHPLVSGQVSTLSSLFLFLHLLFCTWLTHCLIMEAVRTSETLVNLYQTTWHDIP